MATISYLWKNRAKFDAVSKQFYYVWAKRILSCPELLKRNGRRSRLIRKGASIHELAEIGEVNISGKFNLLSINKLSFLGRVSIHLYEKVIIGERVCINDGVEILTGSHDVTDPEWKHIKKPIIIEDYVWIGTGALILPGVILKKGCVVAARAVVTKSVEPFEIVGGNPARAISKKRVQELNYNPCEFIAANRAWLLG